MFLKIVANQARHRWMISLLLVLAMTSLVALYVYIQNTSRFSNRSMQIIVKNMGHNMTILPEIANPMDTYLCTDRQTLFSDKTTRRLAQYPHLASKYYVSVLQERIDIGEHNLILTGIEPVKRSDETPEKGNMIAAVAKGTVRLGSGAATTLNADESGSIEVLGATFTVVETLPEKGTIDDYRIFVDLADCQKLLGKQEKINVILAFLCLHRGTLDSVKSYQQRELARFFPDSGISPKSTSPEDATWHE